MQIFLGKWLRLLGAESVDVLKIIQDRLSDHEKEMKEKEVAPSDKKDSDHDQDQQ